MEGAEDHLENVITTQNNNYSLHISWKVMSLAEPHEEQRNDTFHIICQFLFSVLSHKYSNSGTTTMKQEKFVTVEINGISLPWLSTRFSSGVQRYGWHLYTVYPSGVMILDLHYELNRILYLPNIFFLCRLGKVITGTTIDYWAYGRCLKRVRINIDN